MKLGMKHLWIIREGYSSLPPSFAHLLTCLLAYSDSKLKNTDIILVKLMLSSQIWYIKSLDKKQDI